MNTVLWETHLETLRFGDSIPISNYLKNLIFFNTESKDEIIFVDSYSKILHLRLTSTEASYDYFHITAYFNSK